MAETEFGVTYDGTALADGRMPVRDLAPALLALADLFAETSAVAYPDREPVALNIKATEEGSFVVQLILQGEDAWDRIVHLFSSPEANALVNLRDLIIGSGIGLFWLIKRLRGRRIESAQQLESGQIRLSLDDETTVEIPAEVWTLHESVSIRKKARQVVEPVNQPGVDRVEFLAGTDVTVTIEKADLPAYEVTEPDEIPLLERETEMVVSIASVVFTEGNKWRFTTGDSTFYAAIEDEGFAERVEHGEAFRKGDMLRCRVRFEQSQRNGVLHTEYHVVEVLEHIPRAPQLRLDAAEEPPENDN